ncbi:hypothetical protein BJX64DRAFT_288532 [Aspergillus heterothallicus]
MSLKQPELNPEEDNIPGVNLADDRNEDDAVGNGGNGENGKEPKALVGDIPPIGPWGNRGVTSRNAGTKKAPAKNSSLNVRVNLDLRADVALELHAVIQGDITIVILQTYPSNPNIHRTSSYLDLAILYGDNQEEQNLMRTVEVGMIKKDCFLEPQLHALSAGSSVVLVMLNRFHNHFAE